MIILTAQNIMKSFGANVVLEDVSFTLKQGQRMGIVGVNGSGKSTLMKILAGVDECDSGALSVMRGLKIGYMEQNAVISNKLTVWETADEVFCDLHKIEDRIRELEKEIAAHHDNPDEVLRLGNDYAALQERFEREEGYRINSSIQGVLLGLGFKYEQFHMETRLLSGGERTRLYLARLLLQKPDILLLDEPTNHLDLNALQWLETFLKAYNGSIIAISHDRYFLDSVCDCMAELMFGRIEQYEAGYTKYLKLRAENIEQRIKAYNLQQKEIARQKEIILRYRAYATRQSIIKAKDREKKLEKMEVLQAPREEKVIRKLVFEARRRSGDDVMIIKDLKKSYDERVLFENFDLHIRSGDRIAVIGPNGVGKTTLLKLLTNQETPDDGKIYMGANVDIGYYDQHQNNLDNNKTVLDAVWDEFPHMHPTEIRKVLGIFLFSNDDVFQPISTLSGGEKGRVALTVLLMRKDNFLLLDEPTNHLDMESREALEDALEDFDGTLLMVSHDRYFINRMATKVVVMSPDGCMIIDGNYDDYLERMRRIMQENNAEASQPTKTETAKLNRKIRMNSENEKFLRARLKELEQQIHETEELINDLDEKLADHTIYSDQDMSKQIVINRAEAAQRLDALYDKWVKINE